MIDGLIATFVVAMLLLGLTSLLIASRVNAKVATENNAAYNAARQVIENVRIYRGVPLSTRDYTKADVLKMGVVPQIGDLANPDITMTLSPWQDPNTAKFLDTTKIVFIRVTITWSALGGTNVKKRRTFASLVSPDGVVQ
ncbi:MAG: hypothetical protein H7145_07330 [Akkermansiaceae bacterium]|nr:hypothetical protein [Armatimonadota bacterium]